MYEKLRDFQLSILGLFLALGFIAGAIVVAGNISKDNITVTGAAYEVVKSDTATWTFNISVKNPNRVAGYKTLKSQIPVIQKYLANKGITPEQIVISPSSSYETYKMAPNGVTTNEIMYYTFNQSFKVNSTDVEKIKELSTSIQELTEQGIDISSYDPEYQYSGMADLKIKLLEAATKDAKERAKAMLKANKNSVGKIRSVKMGVFQITQPTSNSVSDYGINDTSTIDKKVTAVANVVFAIK